MSTPCTHTASVHRAAPILLAAVLGPFAGACRSAGGTSAPAADVAAVAAAFLAEARAAEPEQTARIVALASEHGGRAAGLEHRLKTRESTEEKIERLLHEEPGTAVEDVEVYDALRYTILLEDEPPGNHVRAVRAVLHALEEDGNTVRSVKNYWPRGDSYSGVNVVLVAPDGLLWELQLHTPASYETKSSTQAAYERMRDPATPLAERRRIFRESAELWNAVSIPDHILDGPGTLHPAEKVRVLPEPGEGAATASSEAARAAA